MGVSAPRSGADGGPHPAYGLSGVVSGLSSPETARDDRPGPFSSPCVAQRAMRDSPEGRGEGGEVVAQMFALIHSRHFLYPIAESSRPSYSAVQAPV